MTVHVTPHLNFDGDARAALEHYQAAFGGELVVMTYAAMGRPQDVTDPDRVMWGQVSADNGFRVMAYDVQTDRAWSRGDDPFFVSVRGTDADELRSTWERLAEGGTVRVPLAPAPWTALYGMVQDRFGITWVVDLEQSAG